MKTAALVAILVLGALILAGTFLLGDGPGTDGPRPPMTVDRTQGTGIEEVATMGTAETPLILGDKGPVRAEVQETVAASDGTLNLRVIDALTGQQILKYWVRRSGMVEMASSEPPRLSDPATGKLAIPGSTWVGVSPGSPVEFLVSAPLHVPLTITLEGPGARTLERTIPVTRAASIVGVVRDGASAPIPSARVNLEYLGTAEGFSSGTGEPAAMPEGYSGATLRRTDDSGHYAFGHLPPGVYRTRASRDGTVHISDPVFVVPGRWSLGDHWMDEHVRLSVSITGTSGEPAHGSRILLLAIDPDATEPLTLNTSLPEGAENLVTRYTDVEGRATLGPLSAGTYRVFIQSDAGLAAPRDFTVIDGSRSILELDFHLQPDETHE